MTGEEYLEKLTSIVAAHPNTRVIATDPGDDYHEGGEFDAYPAWSSRDNVIYADCGYEDDD